MVQTTTRRCYTTWPRTTTLKKNWKNLTEEDWFLMTDEEWNSLGLDDPVPCREWFERKIDDEESQRIDRP